MLFSGGKSTSCTQSKTYCLCHRCVSPPDRLSNFTALLSNTQFDVTLQWSFFDICSHYRPAIEPLIVHSRRPPWRLSSSRIGGGGGGGGNNRLSKISFAGLFARLGTPRLHSCAGVIRFAPRGTRSTGRVGIMGRLLTSSAPSPKRFDGCATASRIKSRSTVGKWIQTKREF